MAPPDAPLIPAPVAAKAKRKQRRRQPQPSGKGSSSQQAQAAVPDANGASADPPAKPLKRLERKAAEGKLKASERPHKLDVRYGIERPKAIWHPFPLTGIAGLIGGVILAIGFTKGEDGGASLIGAGGLIMTVAVAEMCLREHLAGFKSHSMLLGFLPVLVVHVFVYFVITDTWIGPVALFVDLSAFALLVLLLHGKYRTAQREAQERVKAAKKRR